MSKGPKVTRGGPSAIPPADYYELAPDSHVFSWSPDPVPGRGPVTQVHLHLGTPGKGPVMVVRFKGTGTLDALIDALLEHREHVWGKKP